MEENPQKSVFHQFAKDNVLSPGVLVLFLVVIAAGIASGYFFVWMQRSQMAAGSSGSTTTASGATIQKGALYGSDDTNTFKDTAEGVVAKGGVSGEGQYHLVRPGGDSQNVYMTSSLVDLSLFLNKKIKVWGQTQKAQTAGWLMDVGRVEVLE